MNDDSRLAPPDEIKAKIIKYQNAIEKLESKDLIGAFGDTAVTVGGGVGGAAASGAIASAAGASTLLGSSTLGSVLGGVFVTTTPVGWVVGCALAAGAVGYGVSRLIRDGEKQDIVRQTETENLRSKIEELNSKVDKEKRKLRFQEMVSQLRSYNDVDQEKLDRVEKFVLTGAMNLEAGIKNLERLQSLTRHP